MLPWAFFASLLGLIVSLDEQHGRALTERVLTPATVRNPNTKKRAGR